MSKIGKINIQWPIANDRPSMFFTFAELLFSGPCTTFYSYDFYGALLPSCHQVALDAIVCDVLLFARRQHRLLAVIGNSFDSMSKVESNCDINIVHRNVALSNMPT